jgi:tryptophan halogenase
MESTQVRKIIVVFGENSGFLAAAALKTRCPDLEVIVIRPPHAGPPAAGEGSMGNFANFLHDFLKVDQREFYRSARPTWQLGTRFYWGPRESFISSYSPYLTQTIPGLARPLGFYCADQAEYGDYYTMLMYGGRVFDRSTEGPPVAHPYFAYQIEPEPFDNYLEVLVRRLGATVVEDEIVAVERADPGISSLVLKSGRRESADLYVDCSPTSLLLGQAMREPYCTFSDTLFCDRALVGSWSRSDEPGLPYTTCRTMSAGWCAQTEHVDRIGASYVYSSDFLKEEQAEEEFRRQNPRVGATRLTRFIPGYYRRCWVQNVIAMGRAGGLVEPLAATGLGMTASQAQLLASSLAEGSRQVRDTHRLHYNRYLAQSWCAVRDFLSVHYRFNRRLDTPFWNFCREATPLHDSQAVVDYYLENGPATFLTPMLVGQLDPFRVEGYYSTLLGLRVPFQFRHPVSDQERSTFERWQQENRVRARQAMTPDEVLAHLRSCDWAWAAPARPAVTDSAHAAAGPRDLQISEEHYRRGEKLWREGRVRDALPHLLEVLRRVPRTPPVHSDYLFLLGHDPDVEPAVLSTEHRWWDRLHGQGLALTARFANVPDPGKRLRLGYVSPDFRRHAIVRFIEPVLAAHDRERVELFGYAEVTKPDAVTTRLQGYFQGWRFTCGRTAAQIAEQVRADGIDVLIDLAGHTAKSRLDVFTLKPAPVQVEYLGYPATTGLATMDYRLTDAVADPAGEPPRGTEELVRLPGCFCCYAPPPEAPEIGPSPSGLAGPTFASTHKLAKLNDGVLEVWARVLKAAPGSRLVIARHNLTGEVADRLRRRLEMNGAAPGQLEFRKGVAEPDKFLDFYSGVDILLDTFPWCGHAITCEALWMGIPVVTLSGNRCAGRMGASLLNQLGLSELVTHGTEQYVGIAATLAQDRTRLAGLRASLRERMRRAPLCDTVGYTRQWEAALRSMWERWCARQTAT